MLPDNLLGRSSAPKPTNVGNETYAQLVVLRPPDDVPLTLVICNILFTRMATCALVLTSSSATLESTSHPSSSLPFPRTSNGGRTKASRLALTVPEVGNGILETIDRCREVNDNTLHLPEHLGYLFTDRIWLA